MQCRFLLLIVVGARPNFVKAAPILASLKTSSNIKFKLIHSGQHYDYSMSKSFFDLFGIPEPDFNLEIGSATHGEQTGKMLIDFEKLFYQESPDLIMVLGDVNSTIAAALAAVKMHIPVAHIEAGLRSFDKSMPEEINRILTDHISSLHFVTEDSAIDNLENEGISSSSIFLVGNVMIDALVSVLSDISLSNICNDLNIADKVFSVITLHRPVNVDTKEGLLKSIEVLKLATNFGLVVFPMHPRTMKSIKAFKLQQLFDDIPRLTIITPLSYIDFMALVNAATFILTDSGGIQSEATFLKVPCITLRNSTEHLITLNQGTNVLTGFDLFAVETAIQNSFTFNREEFCVPDLLDGKASCRIVSVIEDFLAK